ADLSIPEGAAALAKKVRAIVGQRLDIFVSNAGVSKVAAMEEHTIEDFDNLFATNVRSPFFLVKELLPLLGEGSSIIVVSSLGARAAPGNPGQPGVPALPAYAATKGALGGLFHLGLPPAGLGLIFNLQGVAKARCGRRPVSLAAYPCLFSVGLPDHVKHAYTCFAQEKIRPSRPAGSVRGGDPEGLTRSASASATAGVPGPAPTPGMPRAAWPHRRRSGR